MCISIQFVNLADTWSPQLYRFHLYLYSYELYTYTVVLSRMNHICTRKLNCVDTPYTFTVIYRMHECSNDTVEHLYAFKVDPAQLYRQSAPPLYTTNYHVNTGIIVNIVKESSSQL